MTKIKKLLTIGLTVLLMLCMSVNLVEFSKSEYEYIDGYGNINAVSLKSDNIELYVENTICDSQEETEKIFSTLERD